MFRHIFRFPCDEKGEVALEYGIILLIVVLAIVYGATGIGVKTEVPFNKLSAHLG